MTMTSDEFATITLTMPSGESWEVNAKLDDMLVGAVQNIGEKIPSGNTMYVSAENTGASLPELNVGDRVEINSDDPICARWTGHVGTVYAIDHNQKFPYGVRLSDWVVRWAYRHELIKVNTVKL